MRCNRYMAFYTTGLLAAQLEGLTGGSNLFYTHLPHPFFTIKSYCQWCFFAASASKIKLLQAYATLEGCVCMTRGGGGIM